MVFGILLNLAKSLWNYKPTNRVLQIDRQLWLDKQSNHKQHHNIFHNIDHLLPHGFQNT